MIDTTLYNTIFSDINDELCLKPTKGDCGSVALALHAEIPLETHLYGIHVPSAIESSRPDHVLVYVPEEDAFCDGKGWWTEGGVRKTWGIEDTKEPRLQRKPEDFIRSLAYVSISKHRKIRDALHEHNFVDVFNTD